ncbi:MBL fold metallo-hydrolase [Aestuariibius sp. 2305UL40-4]|uniref:MBL fold metallo-hydrolase n=1 Tax=Aestuariibius violaceus TaxID=3234132 RepID=UPI003491F821
MNGAPEPGVAEEIEPGIRRILAPNPSPMTFRGTNTYLIGHEDVAIVDPGPDHPAHLHAILEATRGARIGAILVTHAHIDHSPLARPLAVQTGAAVYAFGDALDGRRPVMEALAASGLAGGGEGLDVAFAPDERLSDGSELSQWGLTAIHTPGHLPGHLCFALGDVVLTGDHVMGWASSLVSPPDGDLGAFMESCLRLRDHPARRYLPGHGHPVEDPMARLDWLIAHRRERERQIAAVLDATPRSIGEIAAAVYTDTPPALLPAAERNVFAHLIDMIEKSRVTCIGPLAVDARFHAANVV